MSFPNLELSFLQQLYEQDTLYFIPEPESTEAISMPATAAVTPEPAPAATPKLPKVASAPPAPVEVPAPIQPAIPARETREEIAWLGEAVKGTYLLFELPQEAFTQVPQHVFLQKVLAAVGLTTQQVKYGNLSPEVVHDVKEIAQKQNAQHILLFGQGLPVANLSRLEFYRMYKFENTRFVLVDALEDIEKSVELKKKLWDVLQKIFLQQN